MSDIASKNEIKEIAVVAKNMAIILNAIPKPFKHNCNSNPFKDGAAAILLARSAQAFTLVFKSQRKLLKIIVGPNLSKLI